MFTKLLKPKTFGTALLHGVTPLTEVADLGGWKSLESVKSYVTPSLKQQEKASSTISSILIPPDDNNNTSEIEHIDTRQSDINMNDITSNATSDVVPADRPDECRVATSHTAVTNSVTSNTVNMPMLKQFDMSKISGLLCGANINCGTINFNFNSSN